MHSKTIVSYFHISLPISWKIRKEDYKELRKEETKEKKRKGAKTLANSNMLIVLCFHYFLDIDFVTNLLHKLGSKVDTIMKLFAKRGKWQLGICYLYEL